MSLLVKEILRIGERQLADAGVMDAAIDSKELYCFLMGLTTSQLLLEYQKTLPDSLCDEYFSLLDKRSSGVPLQHITGVQEFMGYEFNVSEKVLIPRQDTETMLEDALGIIKDNTLRNESLLDKAKKDWDVLDLCCGSGCIGISIAKEATNVKVTCSDLSKDAIEVAKGNASKLSAKVNFVEGDLLEPFKGRFRTKKFDLIISNPPYIKSDVIPTLQREVKDHEPMMALDGGESGLDFYERIVDSVSDCLKKNGVLMFEIGHDQKVAVMERIEKTGKFDKVIGLADLAGRDRIVVAVAKGK